MNLDPAFSNQARPRVAILIDGDNFPRAGLEAVETMAQGWGEVTIRRVFGDMALHKDWAQDLAYTATHSPTTGSKNRADMQLVVAAMDLAHRGLAKAFVIVSDDRDFAPLVIHLREQGYRVEWAGKQRKPPSAAKQRKAAPRTALDKLLAERIKSEPEALGGITLVRLGHLMKGKTVKAQTGKATWRAYLRDNAAFELLGDGQETRVRVVD